ncbi:choloylglycine hydrolase family protein [Rubripirellula amarantea]|nr:choloylglycine hydrolase family protein [Rubripirellula amarantea]
MKLNLDRHFVALGLFALVVLNLVCHPIYACTGITLTAKDGTVVYGRTLEWGSFSMKSRVMIIPRGYKFGGTTPEGLGKGHQWTAKYGMAGIELLENDILADGMNERGLTLGLFYHPGFAEYKAYSPRRAANSISIVDLGPYILGQCETVAEARKSLHKVDVIAVTHPVFGFPPPAHAIITEPSGKAIVVEFLKGETVIYDAPLGVITNSPTYDWHVTNLRNYVNLSPVAIPTKNVEDLDFSPLGGGSGMIGLPGDFTPPSRFVRAVAFSKSSRPTADGPETIYEMFRILDSFNVPLGAAEGSDAAEEEAFNERSATIWTSASDTRNRVFYFHTQHNRRVQRVNLSKIDFGSLDEIKRVSFEKEQDIRDITPKQ